MKNVRELIEQQACSGGEFRSLMPGEHEIHLSTAISLKRIADALEMIAHNHNACTDWITDWAGKKTAHLVVHNLDA